MTVTPCFPNPLLKPGVRVRERGSALVGELLERGVYEGEWRIALPGGASVTCLEENLELAPDE